MKKFLLLALSLVLMLTLLVGCGQDAANEDVEEPEENVGVEESERLILATTTSTQDSGLLDYILPVFEEETGLKVDVVAVGTGKALEMGENGEADILLVHAKASEEEFVAAGHGLERRDVMYNDFVLVGPADDSLALKENHPNDIGGALSTILENEATFVSRGDDSGTHKKELQIWEASGLEPAGEWYLEAGAGMGDVLKMADEELGYTLTDRATYLNMRDVLELEILVEGDENLFNQYGIIPVNPEKNDIINADGAQTFMEWLLSEETQELIGGYGVEEFGQPLFTPNAN